MMELMVSLIWIRLGCLVGVQSPFRNFAYDGICWMASTKGMVIVTCLKASNNVSLLSFVRTLAGSIAKDMAAEVCKPRDWALPYSPHRVPPHPRSPPPE